MKLLHNYLYLIVNIESFLLELMSEMWGRWQLLVSFILTIYMNNKKNIYKAFKNAWKILIQLKKWISERKKIDDMKKPNFKAFSKIFKLKIKLKNSLKRRKKLNKKKIWNNNIFLLMNMMRMKNAYNNNYYLKNELFFWI